MGCCQSPLLASLPLPPDISDGPSHGRIQKLDLAATDIIRDRERGVPRYCEFRRRLRMPVPSSWEELAGCRQDLAGELKRISSGITRAFSRPSRKDKIRSHPGSPSTLRCPDSATAMTSADVMATAVRRGERKCWALGSWPGGPCLFFGARFDVLLYDLTSSYFESDPPFEDKRQFGYSRDKRSDCVQVVIGQTSWDVTQLNCGNFISC